MVRVVLIAGGVAVVGLTAAGAGASVPPPASGTFEGNTSQTNIPKHGVQVKTNAGGKVQRVIVQWRAKCASKGKFWTSTTVVRGGSAGLPQNGDVFSAQRGYTGNAGGGIKGKIKYKLSGQFVNDGNAEGTWSARVVVKRNGRKIDTCKLKQITWTAEKVQQG